MNKYEIMLIIDPAKDVADATAVVETAFGVSSIKKATKLEQTDLAYPIEKSTKAQYMVYLVEAEPSTVAEFTRRSNISKFIWRHLVINLTSEKGYGKVRKTRKNVYNKEARNSRTQGTRRLAEGVEKVSRVRTQRKETSKKVEAKSAE